MPEGEDRKDIDGLVTILFFLCVSSGFCATD